MKITWLGHSCFALESQGYRLLLDPYEDGSVPGLAPLREEADQVLCSHSHHDHCGTGCVTLRSGKASPFTVQKLASWHDDQGGALRGENTIHIVSDGQCRVAHLGDLGCDPSPAQKEQLRHMDALLIPVGGHYTIDALQAKALVDELSPTVAIPMHFRQGRVGYDVIGTVEPFTALCDNVILYPASQLELTPQTPRQVAVLRPQNAE